MLIERDEKSEKKKGIKQGSKEGRKEGRKEGKNEVKLNKRSEVCRHAEEERIREV